MTKKNPFKKIASEMLVPKHLKQSILEEVKNSIAAADDQGEDDVTNPT